MTSLELLAWLLVVAIGFYVLWPKPRRPAKPRQPIKSRQVEDVIPPNAIVVDGSNVMYWGGDPSEKVLRRVLATMREKGFAPIVIFDASVGYRLEDRFMTPRDLAEITGLPATRIYVVDKGVVADEVILDFATAHDLRVVSNDRFRDWGVQFPMVKIKGRLVKGTWQQGSVRLPNL